MHTEGPYRVVKSNSGTFVCGAAPGRIAEVLMCRTGQDVEADANLLAASWELLSIARRWAALDAGSWAVARHANEKAELLRDTRAIIAKCGNHY